MPAMKRSPWLGKTVEVTIDRPMGSVHQSGAYSIQYPVNYGYVSGVPGGDGEDQDAYVLGVSQPVRACTGRVIGVIHRKDDVEDKLVVAPPGVRLHQAQIAQAVDFVERHFTTTVEALYKKSCGAVVFRKRGQTLEYLLLLQRRSRRWSVPKGHMEAWETEEQTAIREIREEAGRSVTLIPGFVTSLEYALSGPMRKQVVLYLARMQQKPYIQREEIIEYRWVTMEGARALLGEGYASALGRADRWLASHPEALG